MNSKTEKSPSYLARPAALTSHFLALSYLFISAILVIYLEANLGYRISTNFGVTYPLAITYPFSFWGLTAIYAVLVSCLSRSNFSTLAKKSVGLGLILHLSFLFIAFRNDWSLLGRLTAPYFIYYIQGVFITWTILMYFLALVCLYAYWKGYKDYFWLPVAYLPLVYLTFSESHASAFLLLGACVCLSILWKLASTGRSRLNWSITLGNLATNQKLFMIAIFSIAFLFRLTASYRLGHMGIDVVLLNSDDAQQYHANALKVLHGEMVSSNPETPRISNYSLGYSLFLAFLYWLSNKDITMVLVIQAFLASLVSLGVYLIGKRVFNEATGKLAAILSALSQLLIYNSANLTREMISIVLMVFAVLFILLVLSSQQNRTFPPAILLLAVLLGFAILVDPVFLIVTAGLSMGFLFYPRSRVLNRVVVISLFWAALFLTVVPLKNGFVSPTTWAGKLSLNTRPRSYAVHVSSDFNPYAKELFHHQINVFAYPGKSIWNILVNPLHSGNLISKKIWLDFRRFFFEGGPGFFDPIFLVANSFFCSNLLFYAYMFTFVGTVLGFKQMKADQQFWEVASLYLVALLYSSTYIVLFFGMTRFRATVHPLLLLISALGISTVIRSARSVFFLRPDVVSYSRPAGPDELAKCVGTAATPGVGSR